MRKELVAYRDPKSPVSEVFRTLRTNIQFMSTNKKMQTLLVTSTFPGEGKSWVVSNLAITFAQAGNKVILIDADMRKGRQYSIFNISPRPGLSNYLSDSFRLNDGEELEVADYLQKTEVENLLVMPAGNIPPNPSELLISEPMPKLLDELKEVCDIIIIDGTPCELVTDSVALSRIVDSTVIVSACGETKKENLGRVIKNIQNVGGKLIGVIVNKVPTSVRKYSETYYYGSTRSNTNPKDTVIRKNKVRPHDLAPKATETKTSKNADLPKPNFSKGQTTSRKKVVKNNDSMEMPKALQNNNNREEVTKERMNNIIGQINSFLDEEDN